MGLFDNIFRPKETKEQIKNATTLFRELVGYRPVFKDWHGEIYESALVRASIDARARHISKLNVLMTGYLHSSSHQLLNPICSDNPIPYHMPP